MMIRCRRAVVALCTVAILVLAGCSSGSRVVIQHVHGLGFSPDGQQLYVPAHEGFVIYAQGKWQVSTAPKHDYMGYAATHQGFYSSGHPAPGSNQPNPLGLVKSTDGGTTLTRMGFQGEIDFHSLGAGYHNQVIYVFTMMKSPGLAPGLNHSADDGKTWKPGAMHGVPSEPIQIAVHPTKANVVAVATERGLYLSTMHGDHFDRVSGDGPITTAAFSPNGEQLLFGYQQLFTLDLASQQARALKTPPVAAKDAIGYVVVSPTQPSEIVFSTFMRDIYRSVDGGQIWKQIASKGNG